jgi:hypothetical protein
MPACQRPTRRSLLLQGGAAATILTGLAFGLQAPASAASPFAPGDIAVYRVGTGSSLTSAGTAIFIDEYTPTGTLVQSIPLPTTVSGSNKPFVDSGTATSDGELTLSSDGLHLVTEGYDAPVGTAGVSGASSATVPRTVALIDASGNIDTSTALTDANSGNNIRSAVTTDGTSLWEAGGVNIGSATDGASTSSLLATQNTRDLQIFNNQLYFSSSSGSFKGVGTVGSGLPTSGTQTLTVLPGNTDGSGSPNGFALATLGAGPGPDTLYVADASSTPSIEKYSLVSGSWVAKGSISLPGNTGLTVEGLAVSVSGGTATLYVSGGGGGASGGGTVWKATDSTGAGNTVSGAATAIITASTNEAFRGVAFAPSAPPTAAPEAPAALLLPVVGLGALAVSGGVVTVRRRRWGARTPA